jgi:hypothetical protein
MSKTYWIVMSVCVAVVVAVSPFVGHALVTRILWFFSCLGLGMSVGPISESIDYERDKRRQR